MQCHTLERHSIYKCFLKGAKDINFLVEYGDDEETKLAQMKLMIEKLQMLHSFTIEFWERSKAHLLQDIDEKDGQCIRQHSATAEYWEARLAIKKLEEKQHQLAQTIELE